MSADIDFPEENFLKLILLEEKLSILQKIVYRVYEHKRHEPGHQFIFRIFLN